MTLMRLVSVSQTRPILVPQQALMSCRYWDAKPFRLACQGRAVLAHKTFKPRGPTYGLCLQRFNVNARIRVNANLPGNLQCFVDNLASGQLGVRAQGPGGG